MEHPRSIISKATSVLLCLALCAPAAEALPNSADGLVQKKSSKSSKSTKSSKTSKSKKKTSKKKKVKKRKRAKSKKPKDPGQSARVAVDGAAVYKFANFDAPILDYYEKNKGIKVSKKVYEGIGGLGSFYKVRLGRRKYGYIADVDVVLSKGSPNVSENTTTTTSNSPSIDSDNIPSDPPFFTRWAGLAVGSVSYSEKVLNEVESASVMLYGIKMSGPDVLFDGPILDFEFLFSLGAPSFYEEASEDADGFLILGSIMPMFPFVSGARTVVYGALGLSYVYAKYDIPVEGFSTVDSQEIRFGAAASLGAGFLLTPKVMFKIDAKYYYELESYSGFFAGLQMRY